MSISDLDRGKSLNTMSLKLGKQYAEQSESPYYQSNTTDRNFIYSQA